MKMRKKDKFRPFARRLTQRIVIALFLTMGVLSYWIVSGVWTVSEVQSSFMYSGLLETMVSNVRNALSDISVATANYVPEIEAELDHPDNLQPLMERMVNFNPHIRSCGISFVADYYPQKGHAFCPYAYREEDGSVVTNNKQKHSDNYLQADWFREALAADSTYWSKPFFDGHSGKTPLTAYMMPIHDRQGKIVAILGVDLSLSWLGDMLKNTDFDLFLWISNNPEDIWSINAFIYDSDKTFITHPDKKLVLAKMDDEDIELINNSKTSQKQMYGDRSVYTFKRTVEGTDWTTAIVVPYFILNIFSIVLAVILVVLMLIGIFVVFFVSRFSIRRAAKPLNTLAESADGIAQGKFDTPLPVIKHNDEIRKLRDAFEKMQRSLSQYIDELKITTSQKASMESELKIAHDIQMSMLPKVFPPYPERDDIDIFGTLTAAKAVGGDLFDFYIRDNRLFFCIGDVSGKGVPASLVMAVTRSLFRNISAHTSEPQEIVRTLNNAMSQDNETGMFVTFFVGVLDLSNYRIDYCNAGHIAPVLISNDVVQMDCEANIPVGVIPRWEFVPQTATLTPQTTIFLYTDGLNEAENAAHALFGEDRIIPVAQSLAAAGDLRPDTVVSQMADAVHAFVGNAEQSDDLTMLAIQLK